MTDHIIAWFGRLGTEWRRKDNRSPADMTMPTEYAPVRSFIAGPIGPGEVTGPVYVNSIPYVPASEVERLRAALQFYANSAFWNDGGFENVPSEHEGVNAIEVVMPTIMIDQGKTARAALGQEPTT